MGFFEKNGHRQTYLAFPADWIRRGKDNAFIGSDSSGINGLPLVIWTVIERIGVEHLGINAVLFEVEQQNFAVTLAVHVRSRWVSGAGCGSFGR